LRKNTDLRCPFCGSTRVSRSHRRGLFERIVLSVLRQRPFHCTDCYKRFYSRRKPNVVPQRDPGVIPSHSTLMLSDQAIVGRGAHIERRGFSRQACQIPAIVVGGPEWRVRGRVTGISLKGCFVESADTVPVGTEIEVYLEVGRGVQSPGRVRTSLDAKGMGVEFIRTTAPNFRRLQDIAKESVRLH